MNTTETIEPRWYILHAYSGHEDRVKKNLEQRIVTMDVQDKVFEAVVPTEEVVEIKDGKRIPKRERMYPGYVLVRLLMDDEGWLLRLNFTFRACRIQIQNRESLRRARLHHRHRRRHP